MINLKASRLRALYDNDEYHVFTAKADGSFNEVIEGLTGEDKEELIDDLIYCIQDLVKKPHQTETIKECKKSFRRIIDEQPTIPNDDGDWIPCSKRMPEEYDSMFARLKGTDKWSNAMFEKKSDIVNITIKLEDGTRRVTSSYTIDGKWKCPKNSDANLEIIAWQPLPDAYKGEEI